MKLCYTEREPLNFFGEAAGITHVDDFMHFDTSSSEDGKFHSGIILKYDEPVRLPYINPFMSIHQNICFEFLNKNHYQEIAIDCLLKYFLIKLEECMNEKKFRTMILRFMSVLISCGWPSTASAAGLTVKKWRRL